MFMFCSAEVKRSRRPINQMGQFKSDLQFSTLMNSFVAMQKKNTNLVTMIRQNVRLMNFYIPNRLLHRFCFCFSPTRNEFIMINIRLFCFSIRSVVAHRIDKKMFCIFFSGSTLMSLPIPWSCGRTCVIKNLDHTSLDTYFSLI